MKGVVWLGSSMIDEVFEFLSFKDFNAIFLEVDLIIFLEFERFFDYETPDTWFGKLVTILCVFFIIVSFRRSVLLFGGLLL